MQPQTCRTKFQTCRTMSPLCAKMGASLKCSAFSHTFTSCSVNEASCFESGFRFKADLTPPQVARYSTHVLVAVGCYLNVWLLSPFGIHTHPYQNCTRRLWSISLVVGCHLPVIFSCMALKYSKCSNDPHPGNIQISHDHRMISVPQTDDPPVAYLMFI